MTPDARMLAEIHRLRKSLSDAEESIKRMDAAHAVTELTDTSSAMLLATCVSKVDAIVWDWLNGDHSPADAMNLIRDVLHQDYL